MLSYFTNTNYLRKDFLSSIVVFLVAIPLCLGIALACGMSATAGLISGIIGGIVVGSLAGCPLQVSGPAAGLIVIVYEVIHKFGIEQLGVIVFCAGLLQITLGLIGIGHWFRAVSPAVIRGMLTGIGVTIFASQFHVMVDDSPKKNTVENLLSIPESILKGVLPQDGNNYHIAALIGTLTIVTILAWNFLPKKVQSFPPALAGVMVAIFVSLIFNLQIKYIEVPENIMNDINLMNFGAFDWSAFTDRDFIIAVISVAFVASAETLLTATAVDNMHVGKRTNYNKEVVAQGAGNLCAGFLGVIPITGVIVRSAANVQSGAVSRMSTILHGFWILLFVLLLPNLLGMIPTASLAAILVYTGYKLINPKALMSLMKFGRSELLICLITVFFVIYTNLLEGIIIGFACSFIKLMYIVLHLGSTVEEDGDHTHVYFNGSATFMNLPKFAAVFEKLPPKKTVHIHLDKLSYVDHACIDYLINWENQYREKGGKPVLESSNPTSLEKTTNKYFRTLQEEVSRSN